MIYQTQLVELEVAHSGICCHCANDQFWCGVVLMLMPLFQVPAKLTSEVLYAAGVLLSNAGEWLIDFAEEMDD